SSKFLCFFNNIFLKNIFFKMETLESVSRELFLRTFDETFGGQVGFKYQFVKIGDVLFNHSSDDFYEIENVVKISTSNENYLKEGSMPLHSIRDFYGYFLKAMDLIPDEHLTDCFMVVVVAKFQSYYSREMDDFNESTMAFFFRDVKRKHATNYSKNIITMSSSSFNTLSEFRFISVKNKGAAKTKRGRPRTYKKSRSVTPEVKGGCRVGSDTEKTYKLVDEKIKVIFPKQKEDDFNCAIYAICRGLSNQINRMSDAMLKPSRASRGRVITPLRLRRDLTRLGIEEKIPLKFSHIEKVVKILKDRYEIKIGVRVFVILEQKLRMIQMTVHEENDEPKIWVDLINLFPVEEHYGLILQRENRVPKKTCRVCSITYRKKHNCTQERAVLNQAFKRRNNMYVYAPQLLVPYEKTVEKAVIPGREWRLSKGKYEEFWNSFGVFDIETFMSDSPDGDEDQLVEIGTKFHRPYAVGFLLKDKFYCFKGPNCIDEWMAMFSDMDLTVCGFNNSSKFVIDGPRVMNMKSVSFNVPSNVAKGKFSHQLIRGFEDVDKYENVVEMDENILFCAMKNIRTRMTKMEWFDAYSIKIIELLLEELKDFKDFNIAMAYGWVGIIEDNYEKLMDYCGQSVPLYPNAWKPYLENDCRSVFWIAKQMQDTFARMLQSKNKVPWMFDYVTISTFAYKNWCHSLRDPELACHSIEIPNTVDKYNFIRAAIYGGTVLNFTRNYKSMDSGKEYKDIKDYLVFYDVCSEYPASQFGVKNFLMAGETEPKDFEPEYPSGPSFWSDNPKEDYEKGYIGFYWVKVFPPRDLLLPIIPRRKMDFSIELVKENRMKSWSTSGLIRVLYPFDGVYSSVILKFAEKFGYKFEFKGMALIYKNKVKGLFRCVDNIYNIKDAEDKKKEAGLDFNPAMRSSAKLMLNAGYGQHCMHARSTQKVIIDSYDGILKYLAKGSILKFSLFNTAKKKKIIAVFENATFENTKPTQNGAIVLDIARTIFFSHLWRLQSRRRSDGTLQMFSEGVVAYGDTDSVIFHADFEKKFGGVGLGHMINEKPGVKIFEFRSNGPKSYIMKSVNQREEVKIEAFKFKGIPLNCKVVKDGKPDHDFDFKKDPVFSEKTLVSFPNNFKRNLSVKAENAFLTFTSVMSTRTINPYQFKSMKYSPEFNLWFPFGYDYSNVSLDYKVNYCLSHIYCPDSAKVETNEAFFARDENENKELNALIACFSPEPVDSLEIGEKLSYESDEEKTAVKRSYSEMLKDESSLPSSHSSLFELDPLMLSFEDEIKAHEVEGNEEGLTFFGKLLTKAQVEYVKKKKQEDPTYNHEEDLDFDMEVILIITFFLFVFVKRDFVNNIESHHDLISLATSACSKSSSNSLVGGFLRFFFSSLIFFQSTNCFFTSSFFLISSCSDIFLIKEKMDWSFQAKKNRKRNFSEFKKEEIALYPGESALSPEQKCAFCEHEFEMISGDSVCIKCGGFIESQDLVNDWAPVKEAFYLPRVYSRDMYFDKKVCAWLKEDNLFNTAGTFISLETLQCPCTWKEKVFYGFYSFNWIEPDYTEEDSQIVNKIDQAFEELSKRYKWKLKKKLNIYYVLSKVIQLRGGDYKLVPNKLTEASLKKLDLYWKNVCDEFGWNFIPSELVKLDWCKDKVLKELHETGQCGSIMVGQLDKKWELKEKRIYYYNKLERAISGKYRPKNETLKRIIVDYTRNNWVFDDQIFQRVYKYFLYSKSIFKKSKPNITGNIVIDVNSFNDNLF
ncbi:hypothetical protein RFI_23940, partial [Reticulomyxa filosa]